MVPPVQKAKPLSLRAAILIWGSKYFVALFVSWMGGALVTTVVTVRGATLEKNEKAKQ